MPLPVFLTDRAQRDIEDSYSWWAEHRSAEQAIRWRNACEQAIDALPHNAQQCPLSPESERFPAEVRQRHLGLGRRPSHRVIFTIRPDMILVLRVQHLAQQELSLDDLIS